MYVSKDKDFLLHCLSPSLVACTVGMTMPSSRAVVSRACEGLHQDLNGYLLFTTCWAPGTTRAPRAQPRGQTNPGPFLSPSIHLPCLWGTLLSLSLSVLAFKNAASSSYLMG